ncbi:unnamed protein product [Rotaria socialis]
MIEFKECFKGHTIECVFDQARTHTAKSHSVNDFSRSVGTKCTVDKIQYLDPNGKARSIDCFFQSDPNKGLSKGVDVIAKELGIAQPEKFKLPALLDHLSTHPAFQNVSRLELLAQKYHVRIHFCPKFHYELFANHIANLLQPYEYETVCSNVKCPVRRKSHQSSRLSFNVKNGNIQDQIIAEFGTRSREKCGAELNRWSSDTPLPKTFE